MTPQEKEDRLIRQLYIVIPAFLIGGFLTTVGVLTVMISYNFNILSWLE